MIPEVREYLGCYHWVHIYLRFIKQYVVDKRKKQVGMKQDPDEQQIQDVVHDDQIQLHWRMFFQDNNGGLDGMKYFIHDKKWDV